MSLRGVAVLTNAFMVMWLRQEVLYHTFNCESPDLVILTTDSTCFWHITLINPPFSWDLEIDLEIVEAVGCDSQQVVNEVKWVSRGKQLWVCHLLQKQAQIGKNWGKSTVRVRRKDRTDGQQGGESCCRAGFRSFVPDTYVPLCVTNGMTWWGETLIAFCGHLWSIFGSV